MLSTVVWSLLELSDQVTREDRSTQWEAKSTVVNEQRRSVRVKFVARRRSTFARPHLQAVSCRHTSSSFIVWLVRGEQIVSELRRRTRHPRFALLLVRRTRATIDQLGHLFEGQCSAFLRSFELEVRSIFSTCASCPVGNSFFEPRWENVDRSPDSKWTRSSF